MKKETRSATEEKKLKSEHESFTSTPGWVKVSVVIGIVLVLLVVLIMFVSGGNHGPGRHMPSSIGVEQGVYNL